MLCMRAPCTCIYALLTAALLPEAFSFCLFLCFSSYEHTVSSVRTATGNALQCAIRCTPVHTRLALLTALQTLHGKNGADQERKNKSLCYVANGSNDTARSSAKPDAKPTAIMKLHAILQSAAGRLTQMRTCQ